VLSAAQRLRRRGEFAAAVRGGRRASRGVLVVHVLTPRSGADPARSTRAGFVVSKAVGGAVVRNQVKRRLRHLIRDRLAALPAGTDVVVRALPGAADHPYHRLADDLTAALAAAIARSPRGRRETR
jgi:ribonuclease P protein component